MDAPLIEVRDGKLFWRGRFKTQADAHAILAEFEGRANDPNHYYRHHAGELAKRLTKAMRAAGYIKAQEIAA
jgi:hypothetical protein